VQKDKGNSRDIREILNLYSLVTLHSGVPMDEENKVDRTTKDTNKAILDLLKRSSRIKISGLKGQDNIAVGIKGNYEIDIQGNAGNYLGSFNDGPVIILHGNCGDMVADNLFNGGVIIMGESGGKSGIMMQGGILVIKGNTLDSCGLSNNGGTIIVDGDVNGDIAEKMTKGTMIVTGNITGSMGEGATGGELICTVTPSNTKEGMNITELSNKDLSTLKKYFDHYGIKAIPKTFKKVVFSKGRD
jgi:glutamate synthase domain-containing protein 3